MTERCSYCGRFVSYDADSSTSFGTYLDCEPPDPDYYCDPCVEHLERRAVRTSDLPTNWVKSRWEQRAAKTLGFVRAGPKGAGWTHLCSPDNLPAGWVEA